MTGLALRRLLEAIPALIVVSIIMFGLLALGPNPLELLKQNPNPTREEARHGMAGNLCRCGAYENYLNGVMRAAASMKTSAT